MKYRNKKNKFKIKNESKIANTYKILTKSIKKYRSINGNHQKNINLHINTNMVIKS